MEAGGIAALSGCMAAEGRSELCAEAGTSELPPARLGLTGTWQRHAARACPGSGRGSTPHGGPEAVPERSPGSAGPAWRAERAPCCPHAAGAALRGAATVKLVKFSNSVGKRRLSTLAWYPAVYDPLALHLLSG